MQEQILGDYRIVKTIGTGALGKVFLGEHRFIKKQYALKVLPAELSEDEEFIKRFEEQITTLAQLDHPNIVKIHTVSQADNGYFLVTDAIVDSFGEATNLAQFMSARKERLREEELIALLRAVADALDYAHIKNGIAHGALKLNNFIIRNGNQNLEIFISDFGISKMISPGKLVARAFKSMSDALSLLPSIEGAEEKYLPGPINIENLSKLSHSFLQSYCFLAPEQKRFEQITAAADSYAFGLLAYYLITGHFPEGAFPLPSTLFPEYQGDWDTLITSCLHPDPKLRPKILLPLLEKRKNPHPQKESLFNRLAIEPSHALPKFCAAEEPILKPIIQRSSEAIQKSALLDPPHVLLNNGLNDENGDHGEEAISEIQLNAQAASTDDMELQKKEREFSFVVAPSTFNEVPRDTLTPEYNESYVQQLNAMLNREPVITQYQPEKKEIGILEPLQTEMSVIRGGQFFRGSNDGNRDEMPSHKITLNSFALDIHPVTNEQFLRFLEFMGGEKDQNYNDLIRLKESRISRMAGKVSIEAGYMKHPVVGVTWYGAVAYAKWAGKRLPTEAEWEIAARGGMENRIYPTGDHIEKSQANFFASDTTPVMSYMPNAYGLYDMAGNVYEWCHDWYGYNYYETALQEPTNPKGPNQGVYRVLRGGCWKSLHDDLRCSHRHRNNPGTVNSTYGFRCAADVH